jgi:hypothetical protein
MRKTQTSEPGDSPTTPLLRPGDIRPFRSINRPSAAVNGRTTLILRRILGFLSEWDQKQKEQEIGHMIARSGGRLTDELERRIVERVMATDWSVRR